MRRWQCTSYRREAPYKLKFPLYHFPLKYNNSDCAPLSKWASTVVAEHSHRKILEDLCCDVEKKDKNDEFENEKPVRTNGN